MANRAPVIEKTWHWSYLSPCPRFHYPNAKTQTVFCLTSDASMVLMDSMVSMVSNRRVQVRTSHLLFSVSPACTQSRFQGCKPSRSTLKEQNMTHPQQRQKRSNNAKHIEFKPRNRNPNSMLDATMISGFILKKRFGTTFANKIGHGTTISRI